MKIVYMGTPELAATILSRLADEHEIVGVYTRPDAVRGRGKKLVPSPVKEEALRRGLPTFTMKSFRESDEIARLKDLDPDFICVAACSILLPREVLDVPRYECLNVHTSLLPRWRGAAPMQRSILACDNQTGVSIMRMEEGLDTGPFCKQATIALDNLYLCDLETHLAEEGSSLLLEAMDDIVEGNAVWTEQGSQEVTYAEKLSKGELDLDCADSACETCAKVRASDDAHPAHTMIADRAVTVERASVAEDEFSQSLLDELEAGQVVFRQKRLLARSAYGMVEFEQIKPTGKKSMEARAFAAGIQGIKNATLTWGKA